MRKNFAQILKETNIDIKEEYQKLLEIFLGQYYYEISENFLDIYFRGTCITLEEFNRKYDFNFGYDTVDVNIDFFIRFCEYFYNMMNALQIAGRSSYFYYNPVFVTDLILKIIESIGYERVPRDNVFIFVEKSSAAVSVAEILPTELSYNVISYNHYSMKGDLEEKKATILQLANLLEAKRELLQKENKELEKDLFYLFNNFNIRHNNIDPKLKGKYRKHVANMSSDELEQWYDETYQMCLLAFLEIEHADRKKKFDQVKECIENE
ncbi:MAG: hypothetical protein J1E83_08540 [Lachnospiraceae bacterium]|nr:hypothetical protein [Lachnospiraceae bacterium]